MKNNTVLIIDDELQLRRLLGRIIALEGFAVEEAGTLKSGLEILKRKEIDVVICDVKLPDGNGVEFVSEVRTRFPLIEIILLTAYGNIADGVQAIKNGAFDYITKGNDNDRILNRLITRCNRSSRAQQNLQTDCRLLVFPAPRQCEKDDGRIESFMHEKPQYLMSVLPCLM